MSTRAVPAWFVELLKRYRKARGATFTKQELRAYARRIGCTAADETISRYIRFAARAGLVRKLRTKSRRGVYEILVR